MNRILLNDAIGEIDASIVEEFAALDETLLRERLRRKRERGVWIRFGGIAASVLLVVGLVSLALTFGQSGLPTVDTTPQDDPPVVDTFPCGGVETENFHRAEEILTDFAPERIVWGSTESAEDVTRPAPDTDKFTDNVEDEETFTVTVTEPGEIGYRRWEGLYLDATLYNAILKSAPDAVFAIEPYSVSKPLYLGGGELPDPSALLAAGYYVVTEGDRYFIFADLGELTALSAFLQETCDEALLRDTFFRLATREALGLPEELAPNTEE